MESFEHITKNKTYDDKMNENRKIYLDKIFFTLEYIKYIIIIII